MSSDSVVASPAAGDSKLQDCIPLCEISFSAQVAGLHASVVCRQVFANDADRPLEAIYAFPLPPEAAVVGCRLIIGDRTVEAKLKARDEARREYDEAVAAGDSAALLEQERSNVFTMNIGGILPGETIEAVVTYHQPVTWQQGGGRFTIPLVVAPRFIPGEPVGSAGGGWSPDTDRVPDASRLTPVVAKDGVSYTAAIRLMLGAGFACRVTSPSHQHLLGENDLASEALYECALSRLTPDRDFIVCYRAASPTVSAAVHTGSRDGEQFVLVTLVPPGSAVARRSDVVCCLDMSGSMHGSKMAGLKLVAEKVVRRLQASGLDHRLAILAFDHEVEVVQTLGAITDATYGGIYRLEARGGTMAGQALNQAFAVLAAAGSRDRYILLITDGQTEDRWGSVVPGVRVVAVGLDAAVNMAYLSDIARATDGADLAIYPGEDYDTAAATLTGLLSGPVLRGVTLTADGREVPDLVGRRDVFEGLPVTLAFRASELPAELELSGRDGAGQVHTWRLPLTTAAPCEFAPSLWARAKLAGGLSASEQLAVSLQYGVLCSRTAFVAVVERAVKGAKPERVEVPVSLPHTWDYDAVFGSSPAFRAAGGGVRCRGGSGGFDTLSAASDDEPVESMLQEFTDTSVDFTETELGSVESDQILTDIDEASPWGVLMALADLLTSLQRNVSAAICDCDGWQKLLTRLLDASQSWTEGEKAQCYLLLAELAAYGFQATPELLAAVSREPSQADTHAHSTWRQAQAKLGVHV